MDYIRQQFWQCLLPENLILYKRSPAALGEFSDALFIHTWAVCLMYEQYIPGDIRTDFDVCLHERMASFGVLCPAPISSLSTCVLKASHSVCFWVWVWKAEWLVYRQIAIQLLEIFAPLLLKMAERQFGRTFQIFFCLEYILSMVIWMTCIQPNSHSAIYTQT